MAKRITKKVKAQKKKSLTSLFKIKSIESQINGLVKAGTKLLKKGDRRLTAFMKRPLGR